MRFPMLRTTIFLTLVIMICSLLFFVNGNDATAIPTGTEKGKVLGVSETRDSQTADRTEIANLLPINEFTAPAPPVKKTGSCSLDAAEGKTVVLDESTDSILYDNDAETVSPIASITKLVTALVFLENNPGWDNVLEYKKEDQVTGNKNNLYLGDKVKIRDLFNLSLVGSDNSATRALVRSTGYSETEFVNMMNMKMQSMGLTHTHFIDSVGLSSGNVSTAYEVAKFAGEAFAQTEITTAVLNKRYEFVTDNGRKVWVKNTDSLLAIFPQNGIRIIGGKTGYTVSAGYCFVGEFENMDGHKVISVVLDTNNINSRFSHTKKLIEWTYGNYVW